MLEQMLPYLIVKRDISEVVIRYHSRMKEWYASYGATGYTDEIRLERDTFFMQAREMNARNRANHKTTKYQGPAQLLKAVNGEE
jgi:hypothetical protein